jgi:hypothetical protein
VLSIQYPVSSIQYPEKKRKIKMHQNKNKKKQIFRWFNKTSEYWTLSTGYCSVLSTGYSAALSAALCLSGCMGVYEGGFECPPGEGVGCKSISEVNQMVNEGELPKRSPSPEPKTPCKGCRVNEELISSETPSLKPQIWYSPAFNKDPNNQQETIKTKVLDDPYSI